MGLTTKNIDTVQQYLTNCSNSLSDATVDDASKVASILTLANLLICESQAWLQSVDMGGDEWVQSGIITQYSNVVFSTQKYFAEYRDSIPQIRWSIVQPQLEQVVEASAEAGRSLSALKDEMETVCAERTRLSNLQDELALKRAELEAEEQKMLDKEHQLRKALIKYLSLRVKNDQLQAIDKLVQEGKLDAMAAEITNRRNELEALVQKHQKLKDDLAKCNNDLETERQLFVQSMCEQLDLTVFSSDEAMDEQIRLMTSRVQTVLAANGDCLEVRIHHDENKRFAKEIPTDAYNESIVERIDAVKALLDELLKTYDSVLYSICNQLAEQINRQTGTDNG